MNVDVSSEMEFNDFKAYVEAETGIALSNQAFFYDGKVLTGGEKDSLEKIGLKDNDLLVLNDSSVAPSAPAAPATFESSEDARLEALRRQLLVDPAARASFPPGAENVLNDPETFRRFAKNAAQATAQRPAFQGDPNDPENQKKILEMIQQEQIEESMYTALEYNPESFAPVTMLYISGELNGEKIKAFVDSGAQKTIILTRLAEQCGLTRWIDRRFQGLAMGVGLQTIVGQIHNASLKIGGLFFPCSLTVLDTSVDFLLGLDMLKRHQGLIDLKHNVLVLGDAKTEFLPESEIPKSMSPDGPGSIGGSLGGNLFSPENAVSQPQKKQKTQPLASTLQAPHSSSLGATGSSTKKTYPEATIGQLMALGFTRDQVIKALDSTGGNAEFAASYLFQ